MFYRYLSGNNNTILINLVPATIIQTSSVNIFNKNINLHNFNCVIVEYNPYLHCSFLVSVVCNDLITRMSGITSPTLCLIKMTTHPIKYNLIKSLTHSSYFIISTVLNPHALQLFHN